MVIHIKVILKMILWKEEVYFSIIVARFIQVVLKMENPIKNLDKTTEGKLLPLYPDVPWKNVKGLRDIIAHHYFDVDAAQILWIVRNEISPLKEAILFFIQEMEK